MANTLKSMINDSGNSATVFYNIKALRRLFPASVVNRNIVLWSIYKLRYFFDDIRLFRKIRKMDAVVVCDWTPHGFYKDSYNVKAFKKRINSKPVLYYAVQYLMNSPTIKAKLEEGGHATIDRYDWHLTVSSVTEQRGIPAPPWTQIGLNLESTGIKPAIKDDFYVIVDFLRPGYEEFREIQIKVLEELEINYISLEKSYTLEAIREIYKKAALIFVQFPEAYGLPIAECLGYGAYVGTPKSGWPMSWRLDEEPEVHGPGTLPDCFIVYDDDEDLKKKLIKLKNTYHLEKTPEEVFRSYVKHYPSFYKGNRDGLQDVFGKIENKLI